jgi:hypothetical protein
MISDDTVAPTIKRKQSKPDKPLPKPRKPRTVDPKIAAIIAENKAKLDALKREGKLLTSKVREELVSERRINRELHRIEKWTQADKERLRDAIQTTPLLLDVTNEPPTEL